MRDPNSSTDFADASSVRLFQSETVLMKKLFLWVSVFALPKEKQLLLYLANLLVMLLEVKSDLLAVLVCLLFHTGVRKDSSGTNSEPILNGRNIVVCHSVSKHNKCEMKWAAQNTCFL